MSREGARGSKPNAEPRAGTPIWVWLIYALGIVAAAILALSLLFTLGEALLSNDDGGVTYDVSALAMILWSAFLLAAVVTWIVRRRQR